MLPILIWGLSGRNGTISIRGPYYDLKAFRKVSGLVQDLENEVSSAIKKTGGYLVTICLGRHNCRSASMTLKPLGMSRDWHINQECTRFWFGGLWTYRTRLITPIFPHYADHLSRQELKRDRYAVSAVSHLLLIHVYSVPRVCLYACWGILTLSCGILDHESVAFITISCCFGRWSSVVLTAPCSSILVEDHVI